MRGKQRVKYTTGNEWDCKQVCGKTRQNQWKIKKGSMMARRPVTSNAEHRPNKERLQLRIDTGLGDDPEGEVKGGPDGDGGTPTTLKCPTRPPQEPSISHPDLTPPTP